MKNSNIFAAYDIGGTKCASLVGYLDDREFKVLEKRRFATSECRNARECVFRLGRELEEIIKRTELIEQWQKTPDSPEALATIPMVSVSDISELPERHDFEEGLTDGVETVFTETNSRGIVYTTLLLK